MKFTEFPKLHSNLPRKLEFWFSSCNFTPILSHKLFGFFLSQKVKATIPKGIVGGLSALFFKEIWYGRPQAYVCANYAWNNNDDNNNNRPRNFVEPPGPKTVHVENLQLRKKSCCLFSLLKTISKYDDFLLITAFLCYSILLISFT